MGAWASRQRYLIDFAALSLWRHGARSLGLWLIYVLVVFVVASVILYGAAIRREANAVLDAAPDVVVQAMRMGRHEMSTGADIEKLRGLRGADRLEGRLWGYLYDTSAAANFTLQVPSGFDPRFRLERGEAIIGEGVARLRKVEAGKMLFLISPARRFLKLKVREVLPLGSALVSSDLVLVGEADFRAFFDLPAGQYTDIAMRVRNPAEVGKIAEKSLLALPGHRMVTRADMRRTYEAIFSWREGVLVALLSGALLAFAILAFDKAAGLSAGERREIGILKAIGWDTGDVIGMKLWEGAVVSVSAFLAGTVAAYAHVFLFSAPLIEPVIKGWSTLFPRVTLTPTVDALQLATLGFFTVVPYLAAILVPIWRTASADPDRVMR